MTPTPSHSMVKTSEGLAPSDTPIEPSVPPVFPCAIFALHLGQLRLCAVLILILHQVNVWDLSAIMLRANQR